MQLLNKMNDLSLYLVTDRTLSLGRKLEWIVSEAIRGGVTIVQLREKECTTREFVNLAIQLKEILSPHHIPLIINDRVDIALAANADGIHVGQSDMPYPMLIKLIGNQKIIGLSVENIEQVIQANQLEVDYIGLSPVFGTTTKKDLGKPFGLEGIRKAVSLSRHPVVGIGGIQLNNAADVIKAGASGVAVVSAICSAENPYQAAKELIACIHKNRH